MGIQSVLKKFFGIGDELASRELGMLFFRHSVPLGGQRLSPLESLVRFNAKSDEE